MKIESEPAITPARVSSASPGAGRVAQGDFSKLLQQTLNEASTSSTPQATAAPAPLRGPYAPIDSVAADKTAAAVRSSLENHLNLLERYQRQLSNPAVSLRQLHPLVQQIESEHAALSSAMESLPAGSGLKPILNETLVTGSLEILRFNRGEYIGP